MDTWDDKHDELWKTVKSLQENAIRIEKRLQDLEELVRAIQSSISWRFRGIEESFGRHIQLKEHVPTVVVTPPAASASGR